MVHDSMEPEEIHCHSQPGRIDSTCAKESNLNYCLPDLPDDSLRRQRIYGMAPAHTALEYQGNGFQKLRKRPSKTGSAKKDERWPRVRTLCSVAVPALLSPSFNILELSIPFIHSSPLMDGASAAATILQLIETGICVSRAVHQYGVGVKNAKNAAEESVGKLSTSTAPTSFCRCWIDSQSPAMRYKSELDKFKKKVEQEQDVGWAKSLVWQLRWPSKESEIEAAIESFEGCIKHLNLAVALTSSDALIAISKQGEEHGTLLKGAIDSDELQKMYDWNGRRELHHQI
ncbi:hypothetical protein BU15DRAFT_68542 [Melanogaster broomeanus]|nr:hypothetical protein BU15DRAFT_68542 [Melanogaster broomeanus]